jgi:hypothetical protein
MADDVTGKPSEDLSEEDLELVAEELADSAVADIAAGEAAAPLLNPQNILGEAG